MSEYPYDDEPLLFIGLNGLTVDDSLAEMRKAIDVIGRGTSDPFWTSRLAFHAREIDAWLRRGGNPPKEWRTNLRETTA